MRKKVCAVAVTLILALLVGYLFADDDDDNGNYSFEGTGQDACKLTNVDNLENPNMEFCDECENGCGESFIFYNLKLKVVGNEVFGKLKWENCFTDDDDLEFKCSDDQSRLKDGRILKDKRFDNTYISFAVTSEFVTGVHNCPADNNRNYFMLLAIKDKPGNNIIRLEGGATAFSNEDCLGWEAAEIERVVLHSN